MAQEQDFTQLYNTPVPDGKAGLFQAFMNRLNDKPVDYDYAGAFLSGVAQGNNGHFPDTFKKPNHPTFSDESMYNGVDGYYGGRWSEFEGRDMFEPGPANLQFRTMDELINYFKEVEPDAVLGYRGD